MKKDLGLAEGKISQKTSLCWKKLTRRGGGKPAKKRNPTTEKGEIPEKAKGGGMSCGGGGT